MLCIFVSSMGCDAHPHNIFQHITNFQFNDVQAYRLLSANSGMALDVTDASIDDGAKLQQWPFNNGPSQRWTLTQSSDGSYEIVNQNSDQALDAPDDIDVPIQQRSPNHKAAQHWQMVGQTDGSYTLVNVASQLCMSAGSSDVGKGAALRQVTCQSEADQKWLVQTIDAAGHPLAQPPMGAGRGFMSRGMGCTRAVAGGNRLVDKVAVPQIGWATWSRKVAVYSTSSPVAPPAFTLRLDGQSVLQGQAQAGGSRWSLYTNTIDLSSVTQEGVYTLEVDGAPDTCVEISAQAYHALRGGDGFTTLTIADLLGPDSFFAYQRCGTPDDLVRNPDDHDMGLPLYMIGSGGTLKPVAGTTGDVSGGWHDATSTDKELVTHARALENLAYAWDQSSDPTDQKALLDEMIWGASYLFKLQNPDGSWYLSIRPAEYETLGPRSPPRRQELNVDTGSVARAGAALAAMAKVTQASRPELSNQAREAAQRAYAWVLAHPNQFVGDDVVFAGHHGNATGVLDLAVNMAILEPTEAHITYVNNLVLAGTITPGGVWNAIAAPFPGQQTYFGAEDAQAIVPLLHYYPVAPADVQAQIAVQAQNWLQFLQTQQESTWGMSQDDIYAYFGGCGALTLNTAGLLLMYKTLGTQAALEYAQNNMDWVWGRNPFGMGFVPGLGREIGVMPFLRPLKNSYGAVLPGPMTNIDGSSLRITADVPWDAWEVGEATLDASSALLWVLTMLQNVDVE